MKFVIHDTGDSSVGLWGAEGIVSFDDNFVYTADDYKQMKQMLAEHYDIPVTSVYTEEEWNKLLK